MTHGPFSSAMFFLCFYGTGLIDTWNLIILCQRVDSVHWTRNDRGGSPVAFKGRTPALCHFLKDSEEGLPTFVQTCSLSNHVAIMCDFPRPNDCPRASPAPHVTIERFTLGFFGSQPPPPWQSILCNARVTTYMQWQSQLDPRGFPIIHRIYLGRDFEGPFCNFSIIF